MDVVRFFIEHGANVSAKDKFGSTPLHEASSQGHVDLAQFLVKHGADVSSRDHDSRTPLDLALSIGLVDLAGFLVEQACRSYNNIVS